MRIVGDMDQQRSTIVWCEDIGMLRNKHIQQYVEHESMVGEYIGMGLQVQQFAFCFGIRRIRGLDPHLHVVRWTPKDQLDSKSLELYVHNRYRKYHEGWLWIAGGTSIVYDWLFRDGHFTATHG